MTALRWGRLPSFQPQGRGLAMLLAGLVGLGLSGWLAAPDMQAMEALESEVLRLQSRLQSGPVSAQARPAPLASVPQRPWPQAAEATAFWPWLQQRLQAQGVQVLSLRPQAVRTEQGLPEQGVLLRLQGRWQDWLALEQGFHAHVPWWGADQWLVTPAGTTPGEVRIELQARLGLMPAGWLPRPPPVQNWPAWDETTLPMGAELFGLPTATAALAAASPAAGSVSNGLLPGKVDAWRLLGVWRQDGTAHAVLEAGADRQTVRAGQKLQPQGWRVRRVEDASIELAVPGAGAAVRRLTLEGDPP